MPFTIKKRVEELVQQEFASLDADIKRLRKEIWEVKRIQIQVLEEIRIRRATWGMSPQEKTLWLEINQVKKEDRKKRGTKKK